MPVFFQHTTPDHQLLVWELQEEASYFQGALPPQILRAAPAHPIRQEQFFAGRFLLRRLIPDFPLDQIQTAESGRPFLLEQYWQFSLSHTRNFVAAMVSRTQSVGVDVECISEKPYRVRQKYLCPEEEEILRSSAGALEVDIDSTLYTLAWSVKEAAFKALHQTGVDFIRDLPIEATEWQQDSWKITLGGKGSGLLVQAQLLEGVCLAYATR